MDPTGARWRTSPPCRTRSSPRSRFAGLGGQGDACTGSTCPSTDELGVRGPQRHPGRVEDGARRMISATPRRRCHGHGGCPTTLVWAIAAAWAVAVAAQVTGQGQALHHDGLLQGGLASVGRPRPVPAGLAVMIAAMMLPSSLPLIHLFDRVNASRQAAAGQGGVPDQLRRAVDRLRGRRLPRRPGHPPPGRPLELAGHRPALLGGAVLLLAGAFQFSTLKDRCLRVCRHPGGYLLRHYRRGRARRFGWAQATACSVGCCWA